MIKVNSSKDKIVKEHKFYTGIGNFVPVGINLNFNELREAGFLRTKEPVYEVSVNNEMKRKITFYLKNEATNVKLPVDFFISAKDRRSQSGNYGIINNYGQSTFGESVQSVLDKMEWFSSVGARIAKEGEKELLDFLVSWLNVKNFVSKEDALAGEKPDEVFIEDWNALVNGEVSELVKYLEAYPNNEVQCFIFLKDKKYMNVYNKRFERATTTSLANWIIYAEKQAASGYGIPGEYSLTELQQYTHKATTPDEDLALPSKNEVSDDLPF